jgi:outer membrane receptor for ferrienterochelin and colicin
MNFRHFLSILLLLFTANLLNAQTGIIRGRVTDAATNEPVLFAVVGLQNTSIGTTTDTAGRFEIRNLNPGLYNVQVNMIGYLKKTEFEVLVTNVKPTELEIRLESDSRSIDTIDIVASPFNKTLESPVSLRSIGTAEIERTPGGNRDISKTIQSLPGVASPPSFRNDIIIRGGAPNENRFFLDGIEIPNINHFATQGSSGGPVGLLNVNYIREVDFYSGAFPATRGNALSSVFDFKMKDGNTDRLITTGTIGSSDVGLTFDGPIGKNTTFIVSARRSYLQFLFQALGLPFLPTYNDFQYKTKTKFGEKGELTFLGLGAIDQFRLNLEQNETEEQRYILEVLPVQEQWNYMTGATYKHFLNNGTLFFALSRNMLNNTSTKYFKNDESDPNNLTLKYISQESENKFRFEHAIYNNGWKFTYGTGVELVRFTSDTYQKLSTPNGVITVDFDSKLVFMKYALFAQASKRLMDERLTLSLGLRTDFSDYSDKMLNPADQLSPRFSASYALNPKWSINVNAGRYYQLPAYTVLGFRNNAGELVNKTNGVDYIRADHAVAGIEYAPWNNARITVEGFYKVYADYPFILSDSVNLANLGADFGVIGNTAVSSIGKGRSYGLEFLIQQKLFKGFYGIAAYTFVRSEFSTKTADYAPSAWDNGHIVTLTAGRKFKKGWELGMRWRFQGGAPYTPIDVQRSALINVWNVTGQGIPDYNRINTERLEVAHQLDVRVDKKWFLKKSSINLYFDVQNIYNYKQTLQPTLILQRDQDGNPVVDPNNPNAYQTKFIQNTNGLLQPSIGLIIEF